MIKLNLFVVFIIVCTLLLSFNCQLCSSFCLTPFCTGAIGDNCNSKCNGNWIASGNTCIPNSATGWKFVDSTSDVPGGKLTISTGTYVNNLCGSYGLFGWYSPANIITISSPGILYSFFQINVYVSILSEDGRTGCGDCFWSSTTKYYLTFVPLAQTNTLVMSTASKTKQQCGVGSNRERYLKFAQNYIYGVSNSALDWTINNDQTNATTRWGLRQFLVITKSCNWACLTCYGSLVTQCNSCITNQTMWLSNNTCNQTCLTRFGQTSVTGFCVYCDLRCTACYYLMDNCTACTISGVWTSFLNSIDPSYMTCVNPCPPAYFGNKLTRTCDPCNVNCSACLNTANYCTQCISGFAWTGWTCYSPCPNGYYLESNLTNCTKCSLFCQVCVGPSTLCTICTKTGTYIAYLYNTTGLTGSCDRVCPPGNYPDTTSGENLCLPCFSNCTVCTANPWPCQACITGLFLYNYTCTDVCPNGTIADATTGLCLDCNIFCVGLDINMYFPSVVSDKLYIDMVFTQDIDFTTFPYNTTFQNVTIDSSNMQYTIDMFNVTYQLLDSKRYRIVIEPKSYIFLYNATFTVTTQVSPAVVHNSTTPLPFKLTNYQKIAQQSWFLIKGPPFTSLETSVMSSFSTLSSKTNYILTLPGIQEIKKSGIFNLLFSGAQITSCTMLSNSIQSQNLYEGVRFWAVFVFFDAPPYERISDKTKTFISPSVENQIRNAQSNTKQIEELHQERKLFSTDVMYWRFQRTGQTSFFIYDVYLPVFLIALCWAGMLFAHFSKQKKWYDAYASKLFTFTHKIHEISMMYITMGAIVEFIYFEPTSAERFVSAIVCVVFNVYFVIYELYIYYDMIRYPLAQIGNKTYEYYILRYGSFLKNIRYEEYDIHEKWSPKQWFRPYNYHILSYYKKFVMIVSLPLFYNTKYAQIGILSIIQILQIIRFCYIWPFKSKRRNFIRLSLQISLLLFFIINIAQIYLLNQISSSDAATISDLVSIFYGLGWAGFIFCFYFNVGFLVTGIYDFCFNLKISNRQLMDEARRSYYYAKINEYEKEHEGDKETINRWVKLGNLNNRPYGKIPDIKTRIQMFKIQKIGSGKYQIEMKKITSLVMKKSFSYRKANNTTAARKLQKKFVLTQSNNLRLYSLIQQAYRRFESGHVQSIIIKTYKNVEQNKYKEGQYIPLIRSQLTQTVDLYSYDGEKSSVDIEGIIQGFPIDENLFQGIK